MIAKALNIDGLNILVHFILQFEDKVKIAKLMAHSILMFWQCTDGCKESLSAKKTAMLWFISWE